MVGVNCLADEAGSEAKVEILRVPPELERQASERVRAYRAKRPAGAVSDALRALEEGARGSAANLQDQVLVCVKAGATLGEISDAMRRVFGEYREFSGF